MADLANRAQLEAELARRLGRVTGRHRRQLEELLGDPPDLANVPPSFWERLQRETEDEAMAALLLIFIAAATQHGASEGLAAEAGQPFAARRAQEIAQRFADNTRDLAARIVVRAGQQPLNVGQRLGAVLGPARVETIARTETTTAATAGTVEASRINLPDQEEGRPVLVWRLDPGCRHCEFCPLIADTSAETWMQFVQGPPAHINCCCHVDFLPARTPTKTAPPTSVIEAAARRSRVFGFF